MLIRRRTRPSARPAGAVVTILVAAALVAVAAPPPAGATPTGWVDDAYGAGGVSSLGTADGEIEGTVDANGRALVVTGGDKLRRLTVAGQVDPTFAGGVLALPAGYDTLHADGAGTVTVAASTGPQALVYRYLGNGTPDTGFGTAGVATAFQASDVPGGDIAFITVLDERSSGVVALGNVYVPGVGLHGMLSALKASGTLDPTWAPTAPVPGLIDLGTDIEAFDLAVDGDSVLLLAVDPAGGILRRYTQAGDLDPSFGTAGQLALPSGFEPTNVVAGQGAYFVAGTVEDEERVGVLKVLATGVPDPSFGSAGLAVGIATGCFIPTNSPESGTSPHLHLSANFIYVTGYACATSGGRDRIGRFSISGVPNLPFGIGSEVVLDETSGHENHEVVGLGVQPSGRLVVGVESEDDPAEGNLSHMSVVRLRATAPTPPPGGFVALPPARVLDTRTGTGAPTGPVSGLDEIEVQIAGEGGVPATGAAAVVLNVTVTEPGSPGYITAYPTGATAPLASNLNFTPGQTIPNLVTVKLGTGGKVTLYNGSPSDAHLIADIAGYYLAGTPTEPGTFTSLEPARLLDTRTGTGAPTGAVAGFGSVVLRAAGGGGVPDHAASAVILNVTVTEPTASGYIAAYPAGATAPLASNLNFSPGQTIPNLVVVKAGVNGTIALDNGSPGSVHLIADVAGYFLA